MPAVKLAILECFAVYIASTQAQAKVGAPLLISETATCDGRTDDWRALNEALSRSSNDGRELVIDCPVALHIGSDIEKPTFLPSGVVISMVDKGLFVVDNRGVPAFVLLNAFNVTLKNWKIIYDPSVTSSERLSIDRSEVGVGQGRLSAHSFFDRVLSRKSLDLHRITFDRTRGVRSLPWPGPASVDSLVYLVGDTRDVTITGLTMSVPAEASPSAYIRTGVSFSLGYRDGSIVTKEYAENPENMVAPHNIKIADWTLDGYLMGFVGALSSSSIERVTGKRYSDLQDADGSNVGGHDKWFPPPHLFYIYSPVAFAGGGVRLLDIRGVKDLGPRHGVARDKVGEKLSGNASSLKIGANESIVADYTTTRPDGIMDILPSTGLRLSNVRGTFDSDFVHGIYTGIRIPHGALTNVTIEDSRFTDLSTVCRSAIWPLRFTDSITVRNVKTGQLCKRPNR